MMWRKIKSVGNPFKITQREYKASVNALNLFFGAVIGVSLGQIADIPTADYMLLLVIIAAFVSAILFVSYSERRIWNSIMLVIILAAGWYFHNEGTGLSFEFPHKLLPTLTVWGGMAIFTEFLSPVQALNSDQD